MRAEPGTTRDRQGNRDQHLDHHKDDGEHGQLEKHCQARSHGDSDDSEASKDPGGDTRKAPTVHHEGGRSELEAGGYQGAHEGQAEECGNAGQALVPREERQQEDGGEPERKRSDPQHEATPDGAAPLR